MLCQRWFNYNLWVVPFIFIFVTMCRFEIQVNILIDNEHRSESISKGKSSQFIQLNDPSFTHKNLEEHKIKFLRGIYNSKIVTLFIQLESSSPTPPHFHLFTSLVMQNPQILSVTLIYLTKYMHKAPIGWVI